MGRIILRWIFRKWDVGAWTASIWLRIWTGGGPCEYGNKISGSLKIGEFFSICEPVSFSRTMFRGVSKEVGSVLI